MTDLVRTAVAERLELCAVIKELIVSQLGLEMDPTWIDDDQPLFGRGLELDSLDAIELLVSIEFEFDAVLPDDDPAVLATVNAIADHVQQAARTDAEG